MLEAIGTIYLAGLAWCVFFEEEPWHNCVMWPVVAFKRA